jgi:hypothetical protein
MILNNLKSNANIKVFIKEDPQSPKEADFQSLATSLYKINPNM